MTMAWPCAVDVDRWRDAAQRALLLELVDHHGRGVGQLVAQMAEELLAHEFRGEEALRAVGDVVGAEDRRGLRAGASPPSSASAFTCVPFSAVTGTSAAKSRSAAHSASMAASFALSFTRSTLFSASTHRRAGGRGAGPRRRRSSQRPASTTSTIASTSASVDVTVRFIGSVERVRVRVWNPGVSTNTNCASASVRMPWMRWRVVCALLDVMRDVRADELVEERRLADVGPADDRHVCRARNGAAGHATPAFASRELGEDRLGRLLLGRAAARALPSATRPVPSPGTRRVKTCCVRLAVDVDARVARHRQPPALQPFLQARLRVLAERRRVRAPSTPRQDGAR